MIPVAIQLGDSNDIYIYVSKYDDYKSLTINIYTDGY